MNFSLYSFFSVVIAIFSMYFGAGNLIYPLIVGRDSGVLLPIGFIGFLISGVLIPLAGLVAMVLFDGDYVSFFQRLGKNVGNLLIFFCILILGPVIVMPRIITLSHIMIAPMFGGSMFGSINYCSSLCFAILFLTITFFATYKESKIVDILGIVVGPLLLITLIIIIVKGIFTQSHDVITPLASRVAVFLKSFLLGYGTLDLLASLFFSSAIGTLLQKSYPSISTKERIWYVVVCGSLGVLMLAIVYLGLSIIGMLHGAALRDAGGGDLFRDLALNVLGHGGSFVVGVSVCMACISTAIAIVVVVAEYIEQVIFAHKLSYFYCLLITLVSCIPLSIIGLDQVLSIAAGPILYVGYPVLIMLTFCNILYKTIQFRPVKLPVGCVFVISTILYVVIMWL